MARRSAAPTADPPQASDPTGGPTAPGTAGFLRNSLASLLRTTSGAFLLLVVPPVLVRQLSAPTYAAWAIAVEVSTYLGMLDVGALSAVGHFSAGLDPDDREGRGQVLSTVLALQLVLGAVGAVGLVGFAAALPGVFPSMPKAVVGPGRSALLLLGFAALVALLTTALSGYFLTLRRLLVPSAITFLSRAVAAVLVVALALAGVGIAGLAAAWLGATLVGNVAVGVAFARLRVPVRPALVSRDLARRMIGFSGAYALWVLAGFLVVGFDTVIVGRIDFTVVAPYTAAAAAVTVIAAVYGSALAPLVPAAADLAAAGRNADLGGLLVRSTRAGAALVVGAAAVLGLFAHPILRLWVGPALAAQGTILLQVLAVATAVRMLVMPYAVVLFGSGQHGRAWATPIAEGVVNVVASVALGLWFGPTGVAVGTLVGAVAGAALHVWRNLPRTPVVGLSPRAWWRDGLARPTLVLAVVGAAMAAARLVPVWSRWAVAPTAALLTAVACWSWIFDDIDRAHLLARVPGHQQDSAP